MTDDEEVILLSAFYRAERSHIKLLYHPTHREYEVARRCREQFLEVEEKKWQVNLLGSLLWFSEYYPLPVQPVSRGISMAWNRFTPGWDDWEDIDFRVLVSERREILFPDRRSPLLCAPVCHVVIDFKKSALPATGPRRWQIRRDAACPQWKGEKITHQTRAEISILGRARPPNE